jgi:hypothetical protein
VVFDDRAPVDCEPLVLLPPDHPPPAVQAVALDDCQPSIALAPCATELGDAVRLTVGAAGLTLTVAEAVALPPEPWHVRVYVVFVVSAPVERVPLVASVPDQPPDAVQEVAFADDQVSVAL